MPADPPAPKCWHCRQVRATFAASRLLPCCGKTAHICTGCRAEIEDASGRTVAAFLDKLAKCVEGEGYSREECGGATVEQTATWRALAAPARTAEAT